MQPRKRQHHRQPCGYQFLFEPMPHSENERNVRSPKTSEKYHSPNPSSLGPVPTHDNVCGFQTLCSVLRCCCARRVGGWWRWPNMCAHWYEFCVLRKINCFRWNFRFRFENRRWFFFFFFAMWNGKINHKLVSGRSITKTSRHIRAGLRIFRSYQILRFVASAESREQEMPFRHCDAEPSSMYACVRARAPVLMKVWDHHRYRFGSSKRTKQSRICLRMDVFFSRRFYFSAETGTYTANTHTHTVA